MYMPLGKNWELEINLNVWHPLDHISFRKSIDVHFRDPDEEEYEPSFYCHFAFICFSIEIFLGREKNEDYE